MSMEVDSESVFHLLIWMWKSLPQITTLPIHMNSLKQTHQADNLSTDTQA